MSRKRNQWGTITAWTLLLSTALCGCGLGDVEELFTDPVALDEEARKDPKFWEAAVPVEGATNLYELYNDLFMGKPYNDVFRFGNGSI